MSPTAVGHCEHCSAVVNFRWSNCLVRHAPLTAPLRETVSPASTQAGQEAVMVESVSPTAPLFPGWLVAYRNREWVLCGGCDDRQHGTVQECRWSGAAWTVHLTDGQRLPLTAIRSVGKTDGERKLVGAWTIRAHGYDGLSPECGGMDYGDSKS